MQPVNRSHILKHSIHFTRSFESLAYEEPYFGRIGHLLILAELIPSPLEELCALAGRGLMSGAHDKPPQLSRLRAFSEL